MKKNLLLPCLSLLLTITTFSQQPDHFAYSMTDVPQQNGNWVYLRILNTQTGGFSGSLINGTAAKQIALDASTKKRITDLGANTMGFDQQPAFNSGVAALAYDSRHARVYYTPMFIDQLRYYDIKTQQVYYVTVPFTDKPVKSSDQGNIVTRMTFAADGNGYAMTNDATQLIRFTTGKKPQIVDLGTIVDDPANKNVSIHNSCSSYGGDMVADDDGNLYVFSARNNVFKINIESRVATYLGNVNGLPKGFTINAAAVNGTNEVLVGSATESASLFVVDPKTWSATALPANGTIFHTSDLASSNLLISGNKKPVVNMEVMRNKPVNTVESGRISVYPNPVTDNQFVVQFGQLEAGSYKIQVMDATGRQVLQQSLAINGDNQSQKIKMNSGVSKGVYMVKVLNAESKTVFSSKIVLQ
ncbi:MAG TPA: T9SS type A sorting domain-containing protein [Chitinophagaceae bacterium]|nr:T9SS type A sorting domain-containing protein [Chitinophagaceae bacterium]